MWPIRSFAINQRKAQSASGLSKRSRIHRSTDVPCELKAWIRIWYQQFQNTGSILHMRIAGSPYVSDENFDPIHVHAVSVRASRKSARAVNCVSDFDRPLHIAPSADWEWLSGQVKHSHTHTHTHPRDAWWNVESFCRRWSDLFIHKKSRQDRLFAACSIESYSTSFDSWMF